MENALANRFVWHAAQLGWILGALAETTAGNGWSATGCLLVTFFIFLAGWLGDFLDADKA
ncbi:hypothetical protein [Pandoraea anapnoica]|nr:hypothetical protein [Pandoraea anapnoica]